MLDDGFGEERRSVLCKSMGILTDRATTPPVFQWCTQKDSRWLELRPCVYAVQLTSAADEFSIRENSKMATDLTVSIQYLSLKALMS
jgi:hypothetical protein